MPNLQEMKTKVFKDYMHVSYVEMAPIDTNP